MVHDEVNDSLANAEFEILWVLDLTRVVQDGLPILVVMKRVDLIVQLLLDELLWVTVVERELPIFEEILELPRKGISEIVRQEQDRLHHLTCFLHFNHFFSRVMFQHRGPKDSLPNIRCGLNAPDKRRSQKLYTMVLYVHVNVTFKWSAVLSCLRTLRIDEPLHEIHPSFELCVLDLGHLWLVKINVEKLAVYHSQVCVV